MEAFLGDWKLDSQTGFDEIMARLGVGFIARKAGNTLKPVFTISRSGDKFTMKTTSTFKTTEATFSLGETFNEVSLDGRKIHSTVVMNGSTMEQIQADTKGGKTTRIYRHVEGNRLVTVSHGSRHLLFTFFNA